MNLQTPILGDIYTTKPAVKTPITNLLFRNEVIDYINSKSLYLFYKKTQIMMKPLDKLNMIYTINMAYQNQKSILEVYENQEDIEKKVCAVVEQIVRDIVRTNYKQYFMWGYNNMLRERKEIRHPFEYTNHKEGGLILNSIFPGVRKEEFFEYNNAKTFKTKRKPIKITTGPKFNL